MDEERVLAADWMAWFWAVASCTQRERLAEGRLILVWKRRRSPRQMRLVQKEEDEAQGDLLGDTQEEDEESQELALALEDRGQQILRVSRDLRE